MFKLSIISASLLLALNSPVKAQLVPIDNKYELGFDCSDSSTLCLDPMSVQSKIFSSSTVKCEVLAGNCSAILTDKIVFTKDKYAARDAYVSSLIATTPLYNPEDYIIGYQDCTENDPGDPDYLHCYLTIRRKTI